MIKVNRAVKPAELTDALIAELTQAYKNDNTNHVWRKPFILSALKEMTNSKCAYCERAVSSAGQYMQVEHYHPKSIYSDEVVVWDNLLPACGVCNSNKREHDTVCEPIINPADHDPRDHLYLRDYRYRSRGNGPLGEMTIDVLSLNDFEKYVQDRFKAGSWAYDTIDLMIELLEQYIAKPITRRKNKVLNYMRKLLANAQPASEYSAVVATVIATDEDFIRVKSKMEENALWTEEHQSLFHIAMNNALVK